MSNSSIINSVDAESVLSRLKQFVRTPSLTREEKRLAEIVAAELEKIGLSVEEVGGNVIGKWENNPGGKTLIFCGHMDTVPAGERKEWTVDPFGGEVKDNRLYGRGSCDMKSGLSTMIGGIAALKKSGVKLAGNITFIATIFEEPGEEKLIEHKGIVDLLDRKLVNGDATIIAEPTKLVIGIGHKGACNTAVDLTGVSAHASVPHLGVNAIEKAAKFILAAKDMPTADHPLLGKGTLSIDRIRGGDKLNVVPESCRVEIDRRLTVGESSDTVRKDIEMIFARLKAEDPNFKATVSFPYTYNAILIDPSHPLVESIASAFSTATGRPAQKAALPYGTDGAWVHHRAKIPVAVFGPGNIEQAHKPDEFVDLNETFSAARIYALTAANFLGTR